MPALQVSVRKPSAEELQLPPTTALPPGPGNNWGDAAFRPNHHKKQALAQEFSGACPKEYKPIVVKRRETHPELSSASAKILEEALHLTQTGRVEALIPPKPESLEGKVLRFYAYHVEQIPESIERERVRHVVVCFHLHDGTLSIYEPAVPNSGLTSGAVLKRQKVRFTRLDRTHGSDDGREIPDAQEWVEWRDLNIGAVLPICGTRYHLYDCDAWSRQFLNECGVEVPAPFDPLEDPALAAMRARSVRQPKSFESRDLAITSESLAAGGKPIGAKYPDDIQRVQRFIHDSGKMLKFNAYWIDEETNLFRTFEIRYFVEDDTIAIVESVSTGDAISKSFLSRRRVPKNGTTSKGCDLTFSGRVNGMREVYLGDEDSYYEKTDLNIGTTFNLYGRPLHIYDCDYSTREYYRQELGRELQPAEDISHFNPKKVIPKLPVPPHTGFGSPEDSLASCKKLVLCPPKKTPPKEDLDTRSLRFQLKFAKPERHEDTMRQFILTYFLEDDEIMISECALRNTGFTGGKFLTKQKLRKDPNIESPSNFIKLDDIQLGNTLHIHGFTFLVTDIDKNSQAWLNNKGTNGVPPSEQGKVSSERLQQLLNAFQQYTICRFCTQTEAFRFFDKDRDGKVTLGEFIDGLKESQLTRRETEAMAMLDAIDSTKNGFINYKDFFAAVTNPMLIHEAKLASPTVDQQAGDLAVRDKAADSRQLTLRNRVLKAVKERMEARCLNVFEMFRMLSTMPRAYRGRRADIQSLTNPTKDTVFTPVQLRRGITENLGMRLPDSDIHALLGFFFPDLPASEYNALADTGFQYAVDLKTFQSKFCEMEALGQLH